MSKNVHMEPPVAPNSPANVFLPIVFWEFKEPCAEEASSISSMLSITTSHCWLGRDRSYDGRDRSSSLSSFAIGKGESSLLVAMLNGASRGRVSAWCLSFSISSVFLPVALIECILHSFWSCSRLSEWRAGELKRIWVVLDMFKSRRGWCAPSKWARDRV